MCCLDTVCPVDVRQPHRVAQGSPPAPDTIAYPHYRGYSQSTLCMCENEECAFFYLHSNTARISIDTNTKMLPTYLMDTKLKLH